MRVYLAAPVRGEAPPAGSVEAIGGALRELGFDLLNQLPPHGQEATVQQLDVRGFIAETDRMMEADLLVAEVSAPSHGVGWCVAWFLARGRLAVLCCRADARERLSMMLAGNPSPWQRLVVYEDPKDLPGLLREALGR